MGNLSKRTGTAGEVDFAYDASGRMMHDSSRGLSIAYDMDGMPAVFLRDSGSGTWRELAVYDPSGWRVATYSYENGSLVSLRTDIMLDGRKELERRTSFAGSGSSVTEYSMLYGSGSVLGRRLADGTSEWYVKDRQGSLVMSVVNNGLGTALVYEPFGFQRLLYASGNEPAEQYTGKEYDGRLGLTYFGARYFDPSFALWLTPDPARQYLNPYSYGGDPVNGVDRDGRWNWQRALGQIAGAFVGAGIGASIAVEMMENGDNWYKVNRWDWSDIGLSALNVVGTAVLGGPGGAATVITPVSIITRCGYDFDNCPSILMDEIPFGFAIELWGHDLGVLNASFLGGTADWYQGNVVYSGGVMDYIGGDDALLDGEGGEFFGHALFVHDRDDKSTIAHEITHVRQMEKFGLRLGTIFEYMYDAGGNPLPSSPKYRTNPREMDAYYHQFLYDQGCIDIYGNRKACLGMGKDEWTHEQLSDMFYNGYGHYDDETGGFVWDRVGYRYHKGVEEEYGDDWTWRENWWFW